MSLDELRAVKKSIDKWERVRRLVSNKEYSIKVAKNLADESCGYCDVYYNCEDCPVRPFCAKITNSVENLDMNESERSLRLKLGKIVNEVLEFLYNKQDALSNTKEQPAFNKGDILIPFSKTLSRMFIQTIAVEDQSYSIIKLQEDGSSSTVNVSFNFVDENYFKAPRWGGGEE